MIFDRSIGCALLLLPCLAHAGALPCGLADFERSGPGWVQLTPPGNAVIRYVVGRKQLEDSSVAGKAWVINLKAKSAAINAITEKYRKIVPPPKEGSVMVSSGMQMRELQCAEGVFVEYQIKVANLSWSAAESPSKSSAPAPGVAAEHKASTEPDADVIVVPVAPSNRSAVPVVIEN